MDPLKPVIARITDIKKELEDVNTYTISVSGSFRAMPGQFNMIGYPGVGEAPISFSSTVRNNLFEHTIRAVGRVTGFLSRFQNGSQILLRGPYGNGWPLRDAEGKDVLLVAGGLGLAPLRPVLQMILEKRKLYGEVSLIYGARNEESLLFIEEFDKWRKAISVYLTVDEVVGRRSWGHHIGLVTDLLDVVKIAPDNSVIFICGPEIMMRFVCRGVIMRSVRPSRIFISMERRMKCGIAHCGHCQHFGLFVCKDGPVFSYNEVRGLPDGML